MMGFAEAVIALFAAFVFSGSMILILAFFLGMYVPSIFTLQLHAHLTELVGRYTAHEFWSDIPGKQKERAAAIQARQADLEKNAEFPDDDFRSQDRFSAALVWGADDKAAYKKLRKRRKRFTAAAIVAARAQLDSLDAEGLESLLRDGEYVVWKNAWSLRIEPLKRYSRSAGLALIARHGKHSLIAGLVGTVMFFFCFAILKLLGSSIEWGTAWSFFTDFIVLLVIAAVPVLALVVAYRAGFRDAKKGHWLAKLSMVVPLAMVLLVAANASMSNGPLQRWYAFSAEWADQFFSGLTPTTLGFAVGSLLVAYAIRIVWKVPAHAREFPDQVDQRLAMLASAAFAIGCGALFACTPFVIDGRAPSDVLWLTLVPCAVLAAAFAGLSTMIEWATTVSRWRHRRRNGKVTGYPHPLLILVLGCLSTLTTMGAVAAINMVGPIYNAIRLWVEMWAIALLFVATPVLMFNMWRCRARYAKQQLQAVSSSLSAARSGDVPQAPVDPRTEPVVHRSEDTRHFGERR